MARCTAPDIGRLRREIERALSDQAEAETILPLLAQLARAAVPDSSAWIFAHRHLAELAVDRDPWRASIFAKRVLCLEPDDDGAWAILGLAQSLLTNHRFAARAYEQALELCPDNPWYAHNLGHLMDVALGRPKDALPLLEQATRALPSEADIAASYAHALARAGKLALAKRVLKRALRHRATADQAAVLRWLEAGAPSDVRQTDQDEPHADDVEPNTPSEPTQLDIPPSPESALHSTPTSGRKPKPAGKGASTKPKKPRRRPPGARGGAPA